MPSHRCWRCEHEQAPAFLCASCGAVQSPPDPPDYIALLGFEPGPWLDPAELETRYYEMSRRLHPDRHQTASPEEQVASVRATAVLNAAFRTLRDLESRGRYWLERQGESLGKDNNQVPPSLAAFVFEIQEQLAEFGQGADEAARTELTSARAEVAAQRDVLRARLAEALQGWPAGDAGDPERTAELKSVLSELSYLRTLDRDIGRALES